MHFFPHCKACCMQSFTLSFFPGFKFFLFFPFCVWKSYIQNTIHYVNAFYFSTATFSSQNTVGFKYSPKPILFHFKNCIWTQKKDRRRKKEQEKDEQQKQNKPRAEKQRSAVSPYLHQTGQRYDFVSLNHIHSRLTDHFRLHAGHFEAIHIVPKVHHFFMQAGVCESRQPNGTLVRVHCKPGKLRYLTAAVSCQIWHNCPGTLQARQATLSYCSHQPSDMAQLSWYTASKASYIILLQLSDNGALVRIHCKSGKLCYLTAAVSSQIWDTCLGTLQARQATISYCSCQIMERLFGYTASQASYVIVLQPSAVKYGTIVQVHCKQGKLYYLTSAVRYGTLVWVHCKPGKLRYLTAAVSCQIWDTCLGTLQARQTTLSYCSHQLSDMAYLSWYTASKASYVILLQPSAVRYLSLIHISEPTRPP